MNAIRGLVRLMQVASELTPIRLLEIKGGDRRNAIPVGVVAMSQDVPGFVETSNNLDGVASENGK